MFQTMTLGQKYSKKEYEALEDELRIKLFQLQQECQAKKIAVLVTVLGVDGSGRGSLVNTLSSWLDGKKVQNHTFWRTTDEEKLRPEAWKYWTKLPGYGEFGIFFGGWYDENIRKASYGEIDEATLFQTMSKRLKFERTLAKNNYAISKFWLHLSENEHKKRRHARQKEQGNTRFTPFDVRSENHYNSLVETVSKTITMTDRDFAPWFVIDAYNKEFKIISVARALISHLENVIAIRTSINKAENPEHSQDPKQVTALDKVDLSLSLERDDYRKQLKELKNEIYQLSFKAYQHGISSTLAFEGGDAGGKGGAIRRIAASVDSRITRIIPISAPTDEELAHHYLWRFWRHVPLAGQVTIYDRTWYGRVLVERVEKFAKVNEWKRAYAEINNFEEELTEGKNILLKFWMHISPDEQLRRFKEREAIAWKNYKITDEDWRNRERAADYKIAADEMFMRTDTEYAPWHIVPAESKYYARIFVLKTYRDALIKALNKHCKCQKDSKKKKVKACSGKCKNSCLGTIKENFKSK